MAIVTGVLRFIRGLLPQKKKYQLQEQATAKSGSCLGNAGPFVNEPESEKP